MKCPGKEVIVHLVREGTIPDAAAFSMEDLEQHLTECVDCQSFLLRLEAVSESPQTLRPEASTITTPLLDVDLIDTGRTFGRYRLEELVGTGGHSRVFKARHETTGRLVAIKILLQKDFPPERLKAWKRESRLAGRLSHPNVVQILDADQVDGYEYCVFEWMPGGTLSDQVRKSLLSPQLSAEHARDLALGCKSLHDRRILHRDIKPSNILLDRNGRVKLADFGIARSLDETVSVEASEIIGTLGYMSPEQLGTIPAVPTETTDVYGIGAVLYAMLLGKGPFAGSDQAEVLSNATRGEVLPPSRLRKIPKDLETICLKCLEQNPEDRYPTAKTLATDLEHFLNGDPITAARPSLVRRVRKIVRRQPALTSVLAIVMVGLIVALFAYSSFQAAQRARQARASLSAVLDCDVSLLPRRIAEFQQLATKDQTGATDYIRSDIGPLLSPRTNLRLAIASGQVDAEIFTKAVQDLSSIPSEDIAAVAEELRGTRPEPALAVLAILEPAFDTESEHARVLALGALLCGADERSAVKDERLRKISMALGTFQPSNLTAWQLSFAPIGAKLAPHLLDQLELDSPSSSQRELLVDLLLAWDDFNPADVARIWRIATIDQIIPSADRIVATRQQIAKSSRESWQQLYNGTFNATPDLNTRFQRLPAVLKEWIADCQGLVSGDVVALPALPLSSWDEFAESLGGTDYQVLSARPEQIGNDVFVATVLVRSTNKTIVSLDVPEAELAELTSKYAAGGLSPISVWGRYANTLSNDAVRDDTNDRLLISVVWQSGHESACEIVIDSRLETLGFDDGLTLLNEHLADSFWLQNLDTSIDVERTAEKAQRDQVALDVVQPVFTALRSVGLKRLPADNSQRALGYRLQEFPRLSLPATHVHVWERNFRFQERLRKLLVGPLEPAEHRRQFDAAIELGFELEDTFVTSRPSGELLIASRLSARSTYRQAELDQQEARLALACWMLGDDVPLRTELSSALDPSVRAELVRAAESFRAQEVLKLLDMQLGADDDLLRQAIFLMLGRSAGVQHTSISTLIDKRLNAIREGIASNNVGVAGAARWASGQLGIEINDASDNTQARDVSQGTKFTTVAGQEMVRVVCKGQPTFLGAERLLPLSGNASQSIVTPTHDFAIATHEVTFAEFQKFIAATENKNRYYAKPDYSPSENAPLVLVSYYGALEYCRWLSQQEGIPVDQIGIPVAKELVPGVEFERNLVELDGYRLPTADEWQIAVRSGSITDRFIGRCERELSMYGNTASRSNARMAPIGSFMPNPLGLQDVYGNVLERCLLRRHGQNDSTQWNPAVRYELIANMGGSFLSHEMYSSSNCSNNSVENGGIDHNIGFRIARTIR